MVGSSVSRARLSGFGGRLFSLGLIAACLLLFGCGASGGSADHVLRQERDANVEAAERASELNASGDPDAARGVMRERESHLNERIDEIRSSSSYSEEDKERMLRPMEAERDSLQRFGQEYDSIGQ